MMSDDGSIVTKEKVEKSIALTAEARAKATPIAESEEEVAEEAEPEEEGDEDVADYASMKVAELKELLKAAGKPVSGKKADLIARLME